MKHIEYVAYFKHIAEDLKALGHNDQEPKFISFDMWDLENAMKGIHKFPTLGLEAITSQLTGSYNNLRDHQLGAFYIVDRVLDKGNSQEKDEAISRCKEIGWKVISYIINDVHRFQGQSFVLQGFNTSSVKAEKIGPIPINNTLYGYRFTFMINQAAPTTFDASDWHTAERYTV